MQKTNQALRWDVHPDLALLDHADRRDIRCIVLEGAGEEALAALCALGAFCAYRQGEHAALLYAQDSGFAGMDALREALEALKLEAGLSGPFAVAASARGCMLKARLALDTGRRLARRTLYPMDEYGEAALLEAVGRALAGQGFLKEDFCDAAIGCMRRTDARYAQSLHAYLRCGMDMKRAAQQLGVHRNTLAYRLERAGTLFDVDLKDMNRCFELLFSLWLYEALPDGADMPQDGAFDAQLAQAALWQHVERSAGAPVRGGFACRMICVGVSGMPDGGRLGLLSSLRACAPKEAAFAFDEDVLLCVFSPQAGEGFAHQAQQICRGTVCRMVITQAFDAARIPWRAQLCRMALCAGAWPCVNTRDLCSTLLFMAVERSESLTPYLAEDVIRVMDEDALRSTALSRSLYAYLLNFHDLRLAAEQLGMHRNTLEYQMRKIDALIGHDEAGARRFMMMSTYKMLALPEIGRYGV